MRKTFVLAGVVLSACTSGAPLRAALDAHSLLHLEEHLAAARPAGDAAGTPPLAALTGEGPTAQPGSPRVESVARGTDVRRAIEVPAGNGVTFDVRLPPVARFDFGLGVREPMPVTFRLTVRSPGRESVVVFEEEYADAARWAQRSVDLEAYGGKTVALTLETVSRVGSGVTLWAAPTIGGAPPDGRPNVILYVIDGAGAEYMSVYGFNLRTTPNLEALAAQGVVFERAYSNSRWTKPSTSSFLTSLHHSVLGGFDKTTDVIPPAIVPMAEHFHRAGDQTALLTGNPLAGRMSGHERGVDRLLDAQDAGGVADAPALHAAFWRWRDDYPGTPFWVHFQTIDVHLPGSHEVPPPFAGMYLGAEERRRFEGWRQRFGHWPTEEELATGGVDPGQFFNAARMLYAERMAHQDHEIGRLVEQLEAAGQWDNTLLIVASDHAQHESGLVHPDRPAAGHHTHMRPEHTRIPLLFVWPRGIPGNRRYPEAVSMIDVLPTVLDLAALPAAEPVQGHSLAPLLRGEAPPAARPVFFDEFYQDPGDGELRGWIEVIDGRWGASLAVNHPERIPWRRLPAGAGRRGEYQDAEKRRATPLLLYDLWNDPRCLSPVNDLHPDLVDHYRALLDERWQTHRRLAQTVRPGAATVMTKEQADTLRALGYLR